MQKHHLVDALKKRDVAEVGAVVSEALDEYLKTDFDGTPQNEKYLGYGGETAMRTKLMTVKKLSDWTNQFCLEVMDVYINSRGEKTGCYEGIIEGCGCCMRNMTTARFFYIMFKDEYKDILKELAALQEGR